MKIPPVGGAQLFHADRRTDSRKDMRKLIVDFRNSGKAPKIGVVNIIPAAVDVVNLLPEKWLQ
jgi:hypothetical protein